MFNNCYRGNVGLKLLWYENECSFTQKEVAAHLSTILVLTYIHSTVYCIVTQGIPFLNGYHRLRQF